MKKHETTDVLDQSKKEKLALSQKFGALFSAIAAAVATGYVPNYINLYYTNTVGMSMKALAAILLITKITDGVSDIVMGMIIDRTHTKFGKARPWVMAGAAGLAITMLLLFHCPLNSEGGKIAYCTLFYFLVNPIFGTMTAGAGNTLPNLISSNSDHRAVIGVFRSFGSLIPVILIGLVVPQFLSKMGMGQGTYDLVTIIFAVLAVVAGLLALFMIRETVTEESKDVLTEKQPVGEALKALFHNKYFLWLCGGTILYNLSSASSGVASYYALYIFKDVGAATKINLPSILMILLLPLGIPVIKKFGKRQSMVIGLFFAAAGHLLIFFANANMGLFMVGKMVASFGAIPYFVALIPLLGEVCDYALYKTGKAMDGTVSSANSMGEKIGVGLATGAASLFMGMAGYISTTGGEVVTQPASAIFMIRFMMGIFPAICFLLSGLCVMRVDLDKHGIEDIQKELKEKHMR